MSPGSIVYRDLFQQAGHQKIQLPERIDIAVLECRTAGVPYTFWDDEILKQRERRNAALRIPEGIRELRPFSLLDCANVKEIYLPVSLRKLTALSFTEMDSLRRIVVFPQNPRSVAVEGVLYTADSCLQNRSASARFWTAPAYAYPLLHPADQPICLF